MHQELHNGNYATITDFMAAMHLPPVSRFDSNMQEWRRMSGDQSPGGHDWYGAGCRTGTQVQVKVREGWPEGRDRLNDLRSKIGALDLAPVDRRRKLTYGPSGDTLDMTQVYAGRLDVAWRGPKRRVVTGPQKIEICANMICSGGEHADVLFWRGAAAVVLLDVLEAAGYMVRLVVNFGGTNQGGERVSCRIAVKEHGTPLDITSTSAVIMPGFFRALGHAWICNHSRKKISSCGISVQQGDVEEGEILLSHSVRDHGTALAWVNDTIAKINEGKQAA